MCAAEGCSGCGASAQACCPGGGCHLGLTCKAPDMNPLAGMACEVCGKADEPCCPGRGCSEGVCVGSGSGGEVCRTQCGSDGQACCQLRSGVSCGASLACAADTCKKCGGDGQPCCSTAAACSGALICFEKACSACGKPGQPCCTPQMFGDDGCPGSSSCSMGRCS
jgi:hypothetical protein